MYLFNTNTRKDFLILHTQQIYCSPPFVFESQVCSLLTQITAFSCFWLDLSLRNVKPPLSFAASVEEDIQCNNQPWYTSHPRTPNSRGSIHYFTVTSWTRSNNKIFTGEKKKWQKLTTIRPKILQSLKNCNVQNLLVCYIFISQFLFQNWPGHCEELWWLLS